MIDDVIEGYLEGDYKTILEALEDRRIFYISKDGGEFHITEGCDNYFTATLTQTQVLRLSDELRKLATETNSKERGDDEKSNT